MLRVIAKGCTIDGGCLLGQALSFLPNDLVLALLGHELFVVKDLKC